MKKIMLKYIGYQNKQFCFLDETDSTVRFSRVRADLIYDFDLMNKISFNRFFEVAYFVAKDSNVELRIISDLQPSEHF